MTELPLTEQLAKENIPPVIAEVHTRAQGVVDRRSKSLGTKQKIVHTLIALALPFMSAACNSFPSIMDFSKSSIESSQMKDQRNELLTEEQLKEANIRIVQIPDVKLSLKKSVIDFPIFKDAAEGKLKEVVVVLVDHPNLSWNAGYKLPKDIQEVYQTGIINPYERSATEWNRELNPDELKKAMASEAENTNTLGEIVRFGIYGGPGSDIIDFVKKSSPGKARELERRSRATLNPQYKNKAFIFVAVGGDRKPHPDQSYLSPDQFQEIPKAHPPNAYSEGTYRYIGPFTAGSNLRHEVSHYQNDDHGQSKSEYEADTGMFKSIEKAWERKKTEDESGYPIVFETAEGLIITKNIAKQDLSNPAV